jgi:Flp pilus assembly protein TadB
MTQASSSSVTGLVRSAIDDVRELFREELALAKAEVREEVSKLAAGSAQAGAACAALWFAAMFGLVTIALALTAVFQWPYWAGFAVMAVVLTVVGLVLAAGARRSFKHVRAMPRTLATMKENFQ